MPVCHAASAPNNVLSSIVAPIIRAVAEEAENRAIASTEEMIANLEKVNKNKKEKGEDAKRKIGWQQDNTTTTGRQARQEQGREEKKQLQPCT